MAQTPKLKKYLEALSKSVKECDGEALAECLRVPALHRKKNQHVYYLSFDAELKKVPKIIRQSWQLKEEQLERIIKSESIPNMYHELVVHHLRIHWNTLQKFPNYPECYKHQKYLVTDYSLLLETDASNWGLPVLDGLCIDLRIIAQKADEELKLKGQEEENLQDAVRTLNSCYRMCITDKSALSESKKWGTLAVINNLLQIYFKLNNLQPCEKVIRPFEENPLPIEKFKASHAVTYKFYVGKLRLFEGAFQQAEKELSYAFRRCTKQSPKNKRTILLYLIPVKMFLGKMPKDKLLKDFNLYQFVELSQAVQLGNLQLFNETLEKYQDFFIQKGIYLLIEKLTMLTYRNLFKKVYLICHADSKVVLTQFEKALNFLNCKLDLDEIECILANLIYNGYVKGYIAHQKRVLVLSAQNPFPPISSVTPKSL